MTDSSAATAPFDRDGVVDCWNQIGVHGDRSCPVLPQHVHCRNCPVYAAAATGLLNGDLTDDYLLERTAHVATAAPAQGGQRQSIVIFRVAAEWLALPTSVVAEVANVLPIHSLPHRRDGVVLGLASVRGQLLVCVSLSEVLRVDPAATGIRGHDTAAYQRLLVISHEAVRVVCPVDEVHGIHQFDPRELTEVPATVAKATVTCATALLMWRGHSVGVLDDQLVFHSVKRSLA
jgi:chemotaxis-related protein WspD